GRRGAGGGGSLWYRWTGRREKGAMGAPAMMPPASCRSQGSSAPAAPPSVTRSRAIRMGSMAPSPTEAAPVSSAPSAQILRAKEVDSTGTVLTVERKRIGREVKLASPSAIPAPDKSAASGTRRGEALG